MEEVRITDLLSRLVPCGNERRTCSQNRHVRIAQEVFARPDFDTLECLRSERYRRSLLKSIKADIVIPQKPHVVREHFLHAAAAQRQPGTGVIIDVGISD